MINPIHDSMKSTDPNFQGELQKFVEDTNFVNASFSLYNNNSTIHASI
jgi:hypothetical protein